MEDLEIGKIHESEQHRDAVHMAIAPVIAGERISPGTRIKIVDGKAVNAKGSKDSIGIVDPFLPGFVSVGDKFWMFLYPGTITSLRHEWTHPAFQDNPVAEPDPVPITDADKENARHIAERLTNTGERWLRDWCSKSDGPSYDALMEAIRGGGSSRVQDERGDTYGVSIDGDYILVHGTDAHGSIPPEFWDHVEAVTGKKQERRPTSFTCSC